MLRINGYFWVNLFLLGFVAAAEPVNVELIVSDASTGGVLPCRVHLKNAAGEPQKAGDLPFSRSHFVCDGRVNLALEPGMYSYEIERGPEYTMASGAFDTADSSESPVAVSLRRLVDMPAKGWYPGDIHVHRPVEQIELLMRAEDLSVAPVITWWNKRNLWADKPLPDNPVVQFDGARFYEVMAGEDERAGGAFLYFHRDSPMAIADAEPEWPSPISFLQQRGEGTWIDIEKPFWWDVPVALAHGIGDSIGLANNHMCRSEMYESEAWGNPRDVERYPSRIGNGYWSQDIYYHVLNCGLRIPPSAGSAAGVLPNPPGYNRVYVKVDGPLTYEKWWEGLRAGRSFVTNGPMLLVTANGELPGHVFRQDRDKPMRIKLKADIVARDTIPAIDIIQDGKVVSSVPFAEWEKSGSLGAVTFDRSGWFLVRAITDRPDTFRFASTAPFYVEIGETKTRVSEASAQLFLNWVDARVARIKIDNRQKSADVMAYHETARAFWQNLVDTANAE